jgi:hypothetical protein
MVTMSIVAALADENPKQRVVTEYGLLAQLSLPKDKLPEGCEIRDDPKKRVKNRSIITDPKVLGAVIDDFDGLFDLETLEAAYLAVYKEKNELGVFGWRFRTADAATAAHKKLKQQFAKESERTRLWLMNKDVVWLWRDPGTTDECFEHFEKFLQARVDAAKTAEKKSN